MLVEELVTSERLVPWQCCGLHCGRCPVGRALGDARSGDQAHCPCHLDCLPCPNLHETAMLHCQNCV